MLVFVRNLGKIIGISNSYEKCIQNTTSCLKINIHFTSILFYVLWILCPAEHHGAATQGHVGHQGLLPLLDALLQAFHDQDVNSGLQHPCVGWTEEDLRAT